MSFDDVKGYGFISPEDGGEDVFVHANDFGDQRPLVSPGLRVEFEPVEGTRGVKALYARPLNPGAAVRPRAVATRGTPAAARAATDEPGDDECDVLTSAAFTSELSELLLENVPTLTGAQIVQIRQHVLRAARSHGWIED